MESLHLDTPFPPPPNYDPNNPIDRLVWERAGVKAEKFVSEIDWDGPLSHFSKKSGNKARGTSWNPSGGFGSGGSGRNTQDSVDTKSNLTDNGRKETGGKWLNALESLLSMTGSFLGGARHSVESSAEGIVTTVKHPVKTAKAIAETNPQEAADALFEIISDEVIHGEEETRAHFLGRTVGEIALGAFTTKGLGAVKGLTVPNKAAKVAGKVGKAIEGERILNKAEQQYIEKAINSLKKYANQGNSSMNQFVDQFAEGAGKKVGKLDVIDGKVGGKIPVDEYDAIRKSSIKNPNAKSMTLEKYTDSADSYIAKAGKDSSYFDMGLEFDAIRQKHKFSASDMFDYFNKPALDDAISSGKTIRFSHDPRSFGGGFLRDEWEYLKFVLKITDSNLIFEGGFWYVRFK